jgi:thiol-disulfide isomerase/thioredoxin
MKTPQLRYFGAALVVLLGAWAGLKLHGVHTLREAAVTTPAGTASPPDPRDLGDPGDPAQLQTAPPQQVAIPAKLPAFSLKDLGGKLTPVSSWNGKSLMINFWATWCAPCRREIPLLKTLAADWAARDLKIVGIAVDHPDEVRRFAGEFRIDYPLLVGEQDALDVAAAFGMASPAFPFTVFTDKGGEVVTLFLGELHRPQAEFILSEVQDLNQGRVQLPEARRLIAEGLEKLAANHSG